MIIELESCLIKWFEEQSEKVGAIQQLNCFHTQSGGIALKIKNKYPLMYEADLKFGRRGDFSKLGKFCVAEIYPNKFFYGIYGQYNFGMEKRHTNYEAVYAGLESIARHAIEYNIVSIGVPKLMGCDRGGGNWTILRAMLDVIFDTDSCIDLYICSYTPK
jgi:O-acetyl-ADP-ribose deacetylase (regulator of RNase III)